MNVTTNGRLHLREPRAQEPQTGGTDDDNTSELQNHPGNLARELIQVYHALARNDHDFPPLPSALLSGRHGIVFINRHLTTAIEAVAPLQSVPSSSHIDNKMTVRPYHTLLFPRASAGEMLESLTTSSPGPPRRLQQLLGTVHPQKSLAEVAIETNAPLQVCASSFASKLCEGRACVEHPKTTGWDIFQCGW